MQTLTPEQQKQIDSMKRSVQILRAVARNCSDLEAADDINLQCANLEAKIAVLQGTPQIKSVALAA